MKVLVNGEPQVLDDGTTVLALATVVLDRPRRGGGGERRSRAPERVADNGTARRRQGGSRYCEARRMREAEAETEPTGR